MIFVRYLHYICMILLWYLYDICEIFLCHPLKCSLCRNHLEVGCNGWPTIDWGRYIRQSFDICMILVRYLYDFFFNICMVFVKYFCFKCTLCRNHLEVGCNGGMTLDSGNVETASAQLLRSRPRANLAISYLYGIFVPYLYNICIKIKTASAQLLWSRPRAPEQALLFFSTYIITFKPLLIVLICEVVFFFKTMNQGKRCTA